MFVYHLFLPVFYVCMYVYILSYFVNKLEIWWLYLSPIEKKKLSTFAMNHNFKHCYTLHDFLGSKVRFIDMLAFLCKNLDYKPQSINQIY